MPSKLGNTIWYTVQEVADVLGKSYGTVDRRIQSGLIPYSTISNNKVIEHGDLVKILESEKLPESIIEYRLGTSSPKNNEKQQKATPEAS